MIDFLNSDREKRTKKGTPTQWFSFTSSKDRVCVAECEETFQISDIVGKFHTQILDSLCRRRGSRVKHCKCVCLKMRI